MFQHSFKVTRTLIAGLVFGATLSSFAVALAVNTSATRVYYACLNIAGGSLNHVNTTGPVACASGSTPVSWNSKGDTGAMGPQGTQGLRGVPGVKGDTGAQGPKGDGPSNTLIWTSGSAYAGTSAMCQQMLTDGTISSWHSMFAQFDALLPMIPSNCPNVTYLVSNPIPPFGAGSRVFSFQSPIGGYPASSLSGVNCDSAFINNEFHACRVAGLWRLGGSGALEFLGTYMSPNWSSLPALQNLTAGDKLILGSFTWDGQFVAPLTPIVYVSWMPPSSNL